MTQYNTLNLKFKSQLSELESGIKKSIGVILNLTSNLVGDSKKNHNFPLKNLEMVHHLI